MRIIAPVVSMLSTILVAVPALSRVDPAMTSGPTAGAIVRSTKVCSSVRGSQVTKMIFEPGAPRAGQRAADELRHAARRHADDDVLLGRPQPVDRRARLPRSCPRRLPSARRTASLPPAMIACTSSGCVPKVGGISADSRTPSRPLVPAPTKMMRPPFRSACVMISTPTRDPLLLALDRREHLAVFVQHAFDDVGGGQLVDGERGRVDGFGRKGLPLRTDRHADQTTSRSKPRMLATVRVTCPCRDRRLPRSPARRAPAGRRTRSRATRAIWRALARVRGRRAARALDALDRQALEAFVRAADDARAVAALGRAVGRRRPRLLPVPRPRPAARPQPGRRSAAAARLAGAAEVSLARGGRRADRAARRLDAARPARSRDDRAAVRDRACASPSSSASARPICISTSST